MIRSMTGYGAASEAVEGTTLSVEARSVNSRGLKVVVRGPPGSEAWEAGLRALVGERLSRGRVDLAIGLQEEGGPGDARRLDEERVRALLAGLDRLRREFDVPGEPDLRLLAQFGGLFREEAARDAGSVEEARVLRVAERALAALVGMRGREGERLEEDLRGRVAAIREAVDRVRALAPERLERERDRLAAAVRELADGVGLDEDRLAREIALIADRWDVHEELVRAGAHLDAFEEYLGAPAEEPVGKRLGFLVQELQREANTIGAKANDTRISRLVVEMKNEIEKLREQVENVE